MEERRAHCTGALVALALAALGVGVASCWFAGQPFALAIPHEPERQPAAVPRVLPAVSSTSTSADDARVVDAHVRTEVPPAIPDVDARRKAAQARRALEDAREGAPVVGFMDALFGAF